MLAADAATSTALRVVHAAAVEGHLPVPGTTVVRTGRDQPWLVVGTNQDSVRLRELDGQDVQVPRRSVRPDPLDPAMLPATFSGQACRSSGDAPDWGDDEHSLPPNRPPRLPVTARSMPYRGATSLSASGMATRR